MRIQKKDPMRTRKNDKEKEPGIRIEKLIMIALAAYLLLAVVFYFLAGEQLYFRDSRGNIAAQTADAGTIELTEGQAVEQTFRCEIQRLESISVQFGTFIRTTNEGTVVIELLREDNGEVLMRRSFDASEIAEGAFVTVAAEEPICDAYGAMLRIRVTGDSAPGYGVSPLMSQVSRTAEDEALYYNDTLTSGALCFRAAGRDVIWTGLHYWELVAGFAVLWVAFLAIVWLRVKKGKRSYVMNAIAAMKKYRFLIEQLVSRDFKTKYKRSVLGVFWSFLHPLLMMCVQYFVFSTLFKSDIPYFAAYLIIGTVMFNFLSESCGMTLTSILGNAGLITKVYMPKYIYPLTRTMSSMVNLGISLIPLILVCLVTGVHLTKAAILSLFFLMCLVIFCLGLGMLLATSMVFFRDTQFLWGVITMMWMYATPIFYPESILPPNLKFVHQLNPLYHFLKNVRICILDGISPEPVIYAQCLLIAMMMLLVGAAVFYKNQDKFILYL